jgi:hypothetical protein
MAKNHPDEAQDIALIRRMETRTDPSVREDDLILRGEPRGSVPLETTLQKPRAYYPPTKGPK